MGDRRPLIRHQGKTIELPPDEKLSVNSIDRDLRLPFYKADGQYYPIPLVDYMDTWALPFYLANLSSSPIRLQVS
jgi:hypothetical protein